MKHTAAQAEHIIIYQTHVRLAFLGDISLLLYCTVEQMIHLVSVPQQIQGFWVIIRCFFFVKTVEI